MLNSQQLLKWDDYVKAENDRIRSVLLDKMYVFISSLEKTPINIYKTWVYDLVATIVDKGVDFPIRQPLFESVILPVLVNGYNTNEPNCARWLASFNQLIYHSKLAQELLNHEYSEIFLLNKALELNSSDNLARINLVDKLAYYLNFSIHEIPWGVLYGNNGATIEECDLLLDDIAEFKRHLLVLNNEKEYEDLIKECELHFREYKNYLQNTKVYNSYEDYLYKANIWKIKK